MRRRSTGFLVAIGLVGIVAAGDEPPQTVGVVEHESVRLVTHRIRATLRGGASPGACEDVDLQTLDLRWRGREVAARRRVELLWDVSSNERRLHFLAIDTSRSMRGDLELARAAAHAYLGALDLQRDRAAVVTFDDSVLLLQAPTHRRDRLAAAVDRARIGGYTSFHDGLERVIDAASGVLEQQVVVALVTDAVDSASRADGREVFERLRRRPGWTIFGVGLKLPPIDAGRSVADPARLLRRLAETTGGRMYRVDAASRLEETFADVHRRLASQGSLTLVDDASGTTRGKLRVRVPGGRCRIEVLDRPPVVSASGPAAHDNRAPSRVRWDAGVGRPADDEADGVLDAIVWDPARAMDRRRRLRPDRVLDDRCARSSSPTPASSRHLRPSVILTEERRGCVLDSVVAGGLLHDDNEVARRSTRAEWQLRRRAVQVTLDAGGPRERLADWLDDLADVALGFPPAPPWTDLFRRPADAHAYPFENHPALVEGQTLLDMRGALALLLDGTEWGPAIRESLSLAIARERAWLERRIGAAAPTADPERLRQALGGGSRSEQLARRLRDPGVPDLVPHGAAWLGDVAAADLFAEWEARTIASGSVELELFRRRRDALRKLMFASSYARVIGVLAPTWGPDRRRIGFWRVILPRPGWYLERVQGRRRDSDWRDLPLDLIPERPLAAELAAGLERADPAAAAALRRRLEGGSVRYRSLARPRHQGPEDPFDHVAIRWRGEHLDGEVELRLERGEIPGAAVEALADLLGSARSGEVEVDIR